MAELLGSDGFVVSGGGFLGLIMGGDGLVDVNVGGDDCI